MAAGRVDVFVAMGGNFVAAAPDTEVTSAALARCGLTVQISTKLNRSHLLTGAGSPPAPLPRAAPSATPRAVATSSSPSRTR